MEREKRDRTAAFYDQRARETALGYDAVDTTPLLELVLAYAPREGRLLEIGCGSGRDAAAYLEGGYDVTALDGSKGMLAEAARLHPELSGRLVHHSLPEALPFEGAHFDVVTAMAVLMHLDLPALEAAFSEISRVIAPGGTLAYSVSTERPGVDEAGYDGRGRHFLSLPPQQWEVLHRGAGFQTIELRENDDLAGRPGIRWATLICRR